MVQASKRSRVLRKPSAAGQLVPVMPFFSLMITYMRFTEGLTRRICSSTTLPTKPVTPVGIFRQLETNETMRHTFARNSTQWRNNR